MLVLDDLNKATGSPERKETIHYSNLTFIPSHGNFSIILTEEVSARFHKRSLKIEEYAV